MAKNPKRYGKINLFETSVVGIAAYPDAHLSLDEDSFSLIKALGLADVPGTGAYKDELNLENEVMEEEVETTTAPVEETATEEETTDAPEAEETTEAEAQGAEAPAEEPAESEAEKSVNVEMAKAIKLLANELQKSRGLIAEEEDQEAALKKKLDGMSLGELACVTKDSMGRTLFSNF